MYTKIKFSFYFLTIIICFRQEGIAVYSDYLSDNYYLILLWLVLQIVQNKINSANNGLVKRTHRNFKQSVLMEESEKAGAGIILFNDKTDITLG
jgi:hypothetical protein